MEQTQTQLKKMNVEITQRKITEKEQHYLLPETKSGKKSKQKLKNQIFFNKYPNEQHHGKNKIYTGTKPDGGKVGFAQKYKNRKSKPVWKIR